MLVPAVSWPCIGSEHCAVDRTPIGVHLSSYNCSQSYAKCVKISVYP